MTSNENVIGGIGLADNKHIPNGLELQLHNQGKFGYVNVKYRIPGNHKFFDLGEIEIKDSNITLPVTRVFLCHAKEDKNEVKKIMELLHDKGILTWLDEKDLLPGDNWKLQIEQAIEKMDYVLIFLSSNSVNKTGYVNKEIRYALEQYELRPLGKRYLIPILLNECDPPREFKDIHWLKISEDNWFDCLLSTLEHSEHKNR